MTHRGVTLIELLITIVIGAIAIFALVPPFLAEGNFFRKGKRQTEAQRDAQFVLRSMERAGREAYEYDVDPSPAIKFHKLSCPSGTVDFVGDLANGTLILSDTCSVPANINTLIDGVRSRLTNMVLTTVVPNKLVRIQLQVSHQLRATDPLTENEVLETELFLRNGT